MNNKTKAFLLESPVVGLFGLIVLASFYIKIFNPELLPKTVGWLTPLTLLAFYIMYFLGRRFEKKAQHEYY